MILPGPYNGRKNVPLCYCGERDRKKHVMDPNGIPHCHNHYGVRQKKADGTMSEIRQTEDGKWNCHWCTCAFIIEALAA